MCMCNISMVRILILFIVCTAAITSQLVSTGCSVKKLVTCDDDLLTSTNCTGDNLETISESIVDGASVCIEIDTPQLVLRKSVQFSNLSSITITGNYSSTTITCEGKRSSTSYPGIIFKNITGNLSLTNLQFEYCGSRFPFRNRSANHVYSAAVILNHCMNVDINNVVIKESKGMGLMVVDHRGGEVNIMTSKFVGNKLPPMCESNKLIRGGGGVYILIRHSAGVSYSPMSMLFHDCVFENNIAHTTYYSFLYSNVLGSTQEGYGSGGGAYVSIQSGSTNVSITLSQCEFARNHAYIGGGLTVEVHAKQQQKISGITFKVVDSVFMDNGDYSSTTFGGGAYFCLLTSFHKVRLQNVHYRVKNVSFLNNTARLGGAVYYLADRNEHISINLNNSMEFDNCTFERNSANMGAAINMAPSVFVKSSTGFVTVPVIRDCQFIQNHVKTLALSDDRGQKTSGIGTIHASWYNIHFHGHNEFKHNFGTALYIVNGNVDFSNSSAIFMNNTGIRGGAMRLIASSTMIVGPHDYLFTNNTALLQGGAIYVEIIDSNDIITSRRCFIRYSNNSGCEPLANITFNGNRVSSSGAESGGHAIHATTISPCLVMKNVCSDDENLESYAILNTSELFLSYRGVVLDDDPALQPQITTDGAKIVVNNSPMSLKLTPGKKHTLELSVKDDLGHDIGSPNLLAALKRSHHSSHQNHNNISLVYFNNNEMQIKGKPGQRAKLHLYMSSPRQSYISLEIELQDCPPGYTITDRGDCECNADAYVGLMDCHDNAFRSRMLKGYWAGFIQVSNNKSELFTGICPYCDYGIVTDSTNNSKPKVDIPLPESGDQSVMDKSVCGLTRTGVACGRCRKNYTVHFNSPRYLCKPAEPYGCKFGWLFYILSELVPITVIFISVLLLDISFTSGAFNSFILFSQLLQSMNIDAANKKLLHVHMTEFLYGFFDVNFFNLEPLSFCLVWRNATSLHMHAVKYVTILYTLLLIVVVIWTLNKYGGSCCLKFCRITTVRKSVIHGISTFLVICYSKCVNVSLSLLTPVHLYASHDSHLKPTVRVWINGEIVFFSSKHLPYVLLAIFSLITIGFIPPALLITFPLINRLFSLFGCENSTIVNKLFSLNRLKPLLDSFQGCFKDNFRFFAGLFFLYRWTNMLISSVTTDIGSYYTGWNCVLLFMLSLHMLCQPYVKRVHNVIDTLLIIDLLLINNLSFFTFHGKTDPGSTYTSKSAVAVYVLQLVFIYLPLAIMGTYVLTTLCKKTVKRQFSVCSVFKHISFTLPSSARNIIFKIRGVNHSEVEESEIDMDNLIEDRLIDDDSEFTGTSNYFNSDSAEATY